MEEAIYKKGKEELKERSKFGRFKERKWEYKYQKWIFQKNGKLIRRLSQVITTVGILVVLSTGIKVLRSEKENERYIHTGKLIRYFISLICFGLDLIFTSSASFSKFNGIASSLGPYAVTIFKLYYFQSISINPTEIGSWIGAFLYFSNGCGIWIYMYLAHFIGFFAMVLCIISYYSHNDDNNQATPDQLLAYCIFIIGGLYFMAKFQELDRRHQFVTNWMNKKQLIIIKEMNEKIKEEIKSKEQFFACMSHELRNPLNSLLGSLEVISCTKTINMDILSSAQLCGETLLNLIGNILDFSKIQNGKMEILPIPIDPGEKIASSLKIFKNIAEKKNIYIKSMIDEEMPPALLIDWYKLNQVLINVLGNAIKFTETGGIHLNAEWHSLYGNISTTEIENQLQTILSYSSREDLKNFTEELYTLEDDDEELHIPSDIFSNYIFRTKGINQKEEIEELRIKEENWKLKRSSILLNSHSRSSFSLKSKSYNQRRTLLQSNDMGTTNTIFCDSDCTQGIIKIEITDTGIGISKENMKKLFQPFAQAERTTSQRFGGTGLGLWISHSIIKMMGGDMQIESEVGSGSNFMIAIPVVLADENKVMRSEYNTNWKFLKNKFDQKWCLYVEDQIANQLLMKQIFQHLGLRYVIAKNGLEGYKKFMKEKKRFDVIITDLRMPVMSGQEMISKIRKLEEKRKINIKIPIIVTTGESGDNERNRCLNILGANYFINKPIKFEDLYATLSLLLFHKAPTKLFLEEETKEETKLQKSSKFSNQMNTSNSMEGITQKRILVIEDDKFLNSIFAQFIQSVDLFVDQCYSKAEALRKIEENGFSYYDAITLDSQLEDGTGLETVQEITYLFTRRETEEIDQRKMTHSQIIPIISLSGDSVQIQKETYREYNIAEFLQKPISKQSLLNTIISILHK